MRYGEYAPMTLMTGRFSKVEGRDAVRVRARLENLTLSASDAEATSEGLGRDPLLIALHDLSRSPNPNRTIARFVDNVLRRVATERGDLPEPEYHEALMAVASAMLTTRDLQPTWQTVKSWPTISPEIRRLIGILLADGALMTLTGGSTVQVITFRHDRVRDSLLADAMEDLVSRDPSIADEPYYADIVGSILLRIPFNKALVTRIAASNPIALFRALQLLGPKSTQSRRYIRRAIDRWLETSANRGRSRCHLRHAALGMLSETDSPDVADVVRRFPETTSSGQLARLRNGDFAAGIELCCSLHPGTRAPWRDSQIDHAKTYHESTIVNGLAGFLSDPHSSRLGRIGALRLAGHLANPKLQESINTTWGFDDERLAHVGEYLWAFSRCCGSDPQRYLGPVCDAWATLSNHPTSEGQTDARSAVAEYYLQWAFGRYPPLRALDYLIQRASTDELRSAISLLLREVDHPSVVLFIVQELASTSRHYQLAGKPPLFFGHVRDYWRRLQEDEGRGMSIESRHLLLELWQCRTNDWHLRRHAFGHWEATRLPEDVAVLRNCQPAERLADSILHARIDRGDRTAIGDVLEGQNVDTHGRWLWSARHLWSPEMTDALEAILSRRSNSSMGVWGESSDSDWCSSRLIIRLPEAQAEKLMMKHWKHLRYAASFVQAAIYVSTPSLLDEVRRAVLKCSRDADIDLLDGLAVTWGLGFRGEPGLLRKNQVISLSPYLDRLPGIDISSLWHACNERGWFDLRRELVDRHLQPPYPVGKWDPEQIRSRLDKMLASWNSLFLYTWVRDLLRCGVLWDDVFGIMIGWLRCKSSLNALECVAAAVTTFGLRSDLVALESFNDMAPPRSHEIVEDTKFAVRRRRIE